MHQDWLEVSLPLELCHWILVNSKLFRVSNEIGMLIFPNYSGGSALPKHLESVKVSHIRQGITAEEMEGYIKEATVDPLKQLWLEQVLPILQSNCMQ